MKELGEFELIRHYFTRTQVKDVDVVTGIGDDCAILNVPNGYQLAVSTDTLVGGRHFFLNISPKDLAIKALAVNLSDLAACGAIPKWVTLALTLSNIDESWVTQFSDQLFEQLHHYHLTLIGGDTTKGELSLTLTIFGLVPSQQAISRIGATPGDYIYVSGYLGDSAAGLALLSNKELALTDYLKHQHYLRLRHLRPEPRVTHGLALRGYASAMLDLSDGLGGDLRHILKASHCGATIELTQLPLSEALLNEVGLQAARRLALGGGEDYELCFTIPEAKRAAFEADFMRQGLSFYCIGKVTAMANQLDFTENQHPVTISAPGFDHFK